MNTIQGSIPPLRTGSLAIVAVGILASGCSSWFLDPKPAENGLEATAELHDQLADAFRRTIAAGVADAVVKAELVAKIDANVVEFRRVHAGLLGWLDAQAKIDWRELYEAARKRLEAKK